MRAHLEFVGHNGLFQRILDICVLVVTEVCV